MSTAIERTASSKHSGQDYTCYSAGDPASYSVLQAAENSSTTADILSMLADSCNVEVRMAVADNGNALLETILMLALDESADLRYQLAENHNVDESVLKLLSEDSHPYVAHRARKTLERLTSGAVSLCAVNGATQALYVA